VNRRKNLVIVAAGDGSLHPQWVKEDRSYDLWIIYYGKDQRKLNEYKASSDLCFALAGLKIDLARKVLLEQLYFMKHFSFQQYEYIWFPDDDITFPEGGRVEQLFDTARALKADVFQPAIQNANVSPRWEPTRQIPGAYCHRTNIVEVMAHGFSGETFSRAYLPAIHAMEFMKSGWGIDPIWMKIGETYFQRPLRTFVFDCCPIVHTRPTGSGSADIHKQGEWELTLVPQAYTNLVETLQVFSSLHEALSANDDDLQSRLRSREPIPASKEPIPVRRFGAKYFIKSLVNKAGYDIVRLS
jgi:hypothetical protein